MIIYILHLASWIWRKHRKSRWHKLIFVYNLYWCWVIATMRTSMGNIKICKCILYIYMFPAYIYSMGDIKICKYICISSILFHLTLNNPVIWSMKVEKMLRIIITSFRINILSSVCVWRKITTEFKHLYVLHIILLICNLLLLYICLFKP